MRLDRRDGHPRRWGRLGAHAVAFALMGALAAPACADPLTLILLRILRDQVITRALEAAWNASTAAASAPRALPALAPATAFLMAPGQKLDDTQIRQMIDDGFVHLTRAQRDEVYAAIQRTLSDPEHAPSRQAIIEELAVKATAARQMHDLLKYLSSADKERIAAQAGEAYRSLAEEERQQLVHVLRTGAAPIPRDLTDLILGQLDSTRTR